MCLVISNLISFEGSKLMLRMSIAFIIIILISSTCFASEDLFGDYNKDITTDAQAKTINVSTVQAKNIAYRVKNKLTDGVIIKNNEANNFNGLGNVEIGEGANVNNVIIENEIGDNNNIVFINEGRQNF